MKSYSLYRRAQSIIIKHQWNPEWLMIRGNRNGFVLLDMQHHPRPRTGSEICGARDQRPRHRWSALAGVVVFYKLLTVVWEVLQYLKQRTLEQALLCFPWVLVHFFIKLFPAHGNDFHSGYCYILSDNQRGYYTQGRFLKSVTLSIIFWFALWSCLRVHKMVCFQIELNRRQASNGKH